MTRHTTIDPDQAYANAVYAEIADAMRLIAYGLLIAVAYGLGYLAGVS